MCLWLFSSFQRFWVQFFGWKTFTCHKPKVSKTPALQIVELQLQLLWATFHFRIAVLLRNQLPFSHPKDQNKKASWQKILSQKLRREPFQWKKTEKEKKKAGKETQRCRRRRVKRASWHILCVHVDCVWQGRGWVSWLDEIALADTSCKSKINFHLYFSRARRKHSGYQIKLYIYKRNEKVWVFCLLALKKSVHCSLYKI